jgi:hypothetical protein
MYDVVCHTRTHDEAFDGVCLCSGVELWRCG